jgi:4-amino-4-deoxy-L-arabinose transferase-like glycosyltransferase
MVWDEVTHFTGGLLLSRGQVGTWVLTNSLYPPVYDLFTALYYLITGPSVFAGRLVAVTFSALSVLVIYELARELYNKKTALLAAVLFAIMPGIVWLSRVAMIETLLVFVFCLCMRFFFRWVKGGRERDHVIWIAALVVGVAVKYQMLVVAPIILLLGMYFWKKECFKAELKSWLRFPRLAVVLAAVVAVAVAIYALLASGVFDTLLFAIQVGTAQKAAYSLRYPVPVFYFVEMAWFSNLLHPISLLFYAVGLAGLGLLVYRRKREDKFLLLWFLVVYVVFTLIPNREWRYVTIAFPVLAITAAEILAATWGKLARTWQKTQSLTCKWGTKTGAVLLVGLAAAGVFLSCTDAYVWVAQDQIQVPIEQATGYAAQNLSSNQSVAVACPMNLFNQYMVNFYLGAKNPSQHNQTWQYPAEAVDAYTPDFNIAAFTALCQQQNAKYVLLYEYGGLQYFNSTLTAQTVYDNLNQTGKFSLQATFGTAPNRIFVFSFN